MKPERGLVEKTKNMLTSIVMGILLFQVFIFSLHFYLFFLFDFFKDILPYISVFKYFNRIPFLIYLIAMGATGWIIGDKFSEWIKTVMNRLKFW